MKTGVSCIMLIVIVVILEVCATWGIQALWNWLVPLLAHGPRITMLQAFGLSLLISLLTGGIRIGQK